MQNNGLLYLTTLVLYESLSTSKLFGSSAHHTDTMAEPTSCQGWSLQQKATHIQLRRKKKAHLSHGDKQGMLFNDMYPFWFGNNQVFTAEK